MLTMEGGARSCNFLFIIILCCFVGRMVMPWKAFYGYAPRDLHYYLWEDMIKK